MICDLRSAGELREDHPSQGARGKNTELRTPALCDVTKGRRATKCRSWLLLNASTLQQILHISR